MTTHVLTKPSSGINYCNRVVANNTLPASTAPASTATVYLGRMISPVLSTNFSPTGLSGKADGETTHTEPRKCRTIQAHSMMDNGSPKSYRASDFYADLISQPGNRDDPNDIVPDMLVRMPGKVGLLKGRSLVIQQEGVIKRYSRDTPLGGQLIQQLGRKPDYVPLEDTVHVYLEACDKGDDLYRKILAAVRQADPSDIGAEEVAEFRQQVAGFIRNHPDLAEDANNALEDDDLYTLPIDDAITEYNERPHPDDPVYLHPPARPWLEPLLYLLNGGMPVFHNGIRALVGSQNASGTTAVEFPEHPAIQTFQTYIDNHRNLDKLIVSMDDALSQEDKVPALSDQRKDLIQTGRALSKQLKDTLEYGATLSRGTSVKVLEWLLEFSQIPADDQDAAHPHRNTPAGSHPASMPETGTVRPAPSKPTITGIFDTVQGYVRDTANYVDSYFRFPMAEAVLIPADGNRTIESEPDFEGSLYESSNVESTLVSNGAGVDAGTVPGNRTLLSAPAYNIPPFDQNNPNITVSEQAYEYSRLVLGLVQLRLAELEDYQQPFHIVPVLADAGSQSIEYRSIYLPEVSEQDVNDLANPDPNRPGQDGRGKTLAHRLGETAYQSSLWDRLLYPEFGTGAVKSTQSINEVINNLYHFTPGPGYQLAETGLTYQQVLTGRSNARQAIQNSIDAYGRQGENRAVSSGAATHSREKTLGLEYGSTVYNRINDFVDQAFESDDVYSPEDFFQNLGRFANEALKDLPWGIRRDLVSEYTQACHQQRKPVTPLPISQLAQYLELLQAASPDEPALRLTDNVWVRTRDASGLDFLTPYPVDEVLSGALSGFDPEQVRLPEQLSFLSNAVVHSQFTKIMDEAFLRLNGLPTEPSHTSYFASYAPVFPIIRNFLDQTFESDDVYYQEDFFQKLGAYAEEELNDLPSGIRRDFLSKYAQACRQLRKPVTLLPGAQLTGYLECLQRESTESRRLTLTDRVWVKSEDHGLPLVTPYTLDEVLSGALSGYDPQQLQLPAQLASLSDLVVQETWPEVLQEACLRLTDSNETVESYLQRSRAERRAVSVHDRKMLKSYLNLLLPDCMARPHLSITAAAGNLTIHDQVWVKSEHDNTHSLFPYAIEEVLSGAVTGYEPHQLILPSKLEPYRHFITHGDFSEIMHKTYLAHCSARSIATNIAPTAYLDQCQHFNDRPQDNPFFRDNVNGIVNDIIEYQDDMYASAAQWLEETEGTALYEDSQLESFVTHWKAVAEEKKQQLVHSQRRHITHRTDAELERYLTMLMDDDNPEVELSTKVWYKSESDGIQVLIPFTLKEVLTGTVSGLDPIKFIVPPEVEPALVLTTSTRFTSVMGRLYKEDEVAKKLESIKTDLRLAVSPQWFIESKYHSMAREAGIEEGIGLSTFVGYYTVKKKDWYAPAKTVHYTPYDILTNTRGSSGPSDLRDKFSVLPRFEAANSFFVDRLGAYNVEDKHGEFFENLKTNSDFFDTLQEVMTLNSNFYQHTPAVDEEILLFGNLRDGGFIHPFITSTKVYVNSFWAGKITLFSYLTGAKLEVYQRTFFRNSKREGSEIFRWLMFHGGDTFKKQFFDTSENYRTKTVRFRRKGFTRSTFISKVRTHLSEPALENMDAMINTHKEVTAANRQRLFNMLRELASYIGFIPVIGDLIELAATFIIDEIEIQMEDDGNEARLRREQMERLGINAGLLIISSIPWSDAIKKVVKSACDKTNVSWLKKLDDLPVSNSRRYGTHLNDAPGTSKRSLVDGLPNKKLDADGNPIPRRIEPNSKTFNKQCVGIGRKKRAPDLLCGLGRSSPDNMTQQQLQDKVYKPKNLEFATKKNGRLPTLYFSSKKYGYGRLRQDHPKGEKIFNIYQVDHKHVFFENKKSFEDFTAHIRLRNNNGGVDLDYFEKKVKYYGGVTEPKNNYYHCEASFPIRREGRKMKGLHESGGTVIAGKKLNEYRAVTTLVYNRMVNTQAQKLAL